jgi:hypothetical protein
MQINIHYVLYLEERKLVAAGNSAVRKSCAENQRIRTICGSHETVEDHSVNFCKLQKYFATHCLRVSQI